MRGEWDEAGWDLWEVKEEIQRETGSAETTEGENQDGLAEGGHGMNGVDIMEGSGEMDNRVVDGGGDKTKIGGANDAGGRPKTWRKPLRGRRRGKKQSISKEEEERMAQCMFRWLGNQTM